MKFEDALSKFRDEGELKAKHILLGMVSAVEHADKQNEGSIVERCNLLLRESEWFIRRKGNSIDPKDYTYGFLKSLINKACKNVREYWEPVLEQYRQENDLSYVSCFVRA